MIIFLIKFFLPNDGIYFVGFSQTLKLKLFYWKIFSRNNIFFAKEIHPKFREETFSWAPFSFYPTCYFPSQALRRFRFSHQIEACFKFDGHKYHILILCNILIIKNLVDCVEPVDEVFRMHSAFKVWNVELDIQIVRSQFNGDAKEPVHPRCIRMVIMEAVHLLFISFLSWRESPCLDN